MRSPGQVVDNVHRKYCTFFAAGVAEENYCHYKTQA